MLKAVWYSCAVMAQSEQQVTLWDYFGVIPQKMGWRPENIVDNAAEGMSVYTIFDRVTEGNTANEVLGRMSLCGRRPNAVAEARFDQTISEGDVKHGVQIDITNQGIGFPSLRRMTFMVQVLDPYPPIGKVPDEGTHVVIVFDNNAYLRVARLLRDDEVAVEVRDELLKDPDSEEEVEVEDRPQVWDALGRMGLDINNYRLRRLNIAKSVKALVMGASPAYDEAGAQLGIPYDILECLAFDEVDELQRHIETHAPAREEHQWKFN